MTYQSTLDIPLDTLAYPFREKPLLIGGKAMEYYGLRKAGDDIDLVISVADHTRLAKQGCIPKV